MSNGNDEQKAVFVDEKTQKDLNQPLSAPQGLTDANRQFLELIMQLIKDGKINTLVPGSLLNLPVYDALSDAKKSKVDIETFNLLSAVREIDGLYKANFKETFQMNNLVDRLRDTKERLEEISGDVFII